MHIAKRFSSIASGTVLVATLAACGATGPTQPVSNYPTNTYPSGNYPSNTYPNTQRANQEYGRITNIEFVQGSTASSPDNTVRNAVIGGVIGAVVGSVVGKNINDGGYRSGTTIAGAAGGAAIGSQVGKNQQAPVTTNPSYRVTVQTDGGAWRTYEVGSTGDLRVGDRVRVENNVIYRS